MRIFLILLVFFMCVGGGMAYADCTSPAGAEGKQVYNTTHKTMQFCDGTDWYSMKGGSDGSDSVVWLDGGAGKLYYNGGNVGIGVSDPTHQLHITDGALVNGILIGTDGDTDMAWEYESIGTNAPGHNLRLQSGGGIYFHTNMAASGEPDDHSKLRMAISDTGNVGIGNVVPPQAKLHIVSAVTAPGRNFHIENGNKWFGHYESNDGSWNPATTDSQALVFSNDGDANMATGGFSIVPWSTTAGGITIMESGNVGVGIQSPAQKLDVAGSIQSTTGEVIANLTGSPGQFRAIGGNYGVFIRNDGTHTHFLITDSGNQNGGWNGLRPFYFNNASGVVSIGQGLSMNGKKITSVANPTSAQDVATKAYVDANGGGGSGVINGTQLYKCPYDTTHSSGPWATWGCLGQISAVNFCRNYTATNKWHTRTCTPL